jgi:bla regulator protein blaR1
MTVVATPIVIIGVLNAPAVWAQNTTDRQTKAVGKMAFEVASVKVSKPGTFRPPNFPLDPGDVFRDVRTMERPNGRFSANFPLLTYIGFAFKIRLTGPQLEAMNSHLPKWVSTDTFDIDARAPGNPTKDQMRLMMQALLAERFKLAVHLETHEVPILAMTLVKPGKTGPGLRPHAEGPSCDEPPNPQLFPPVCDAMPVTFEGLQQRGGGRNITAAMIAWRLPSMGNLDRPGIDQTGLTGTFDFTLKWTPDPTPIGATQTILKKGSASNAPVRPPSSEPDADGPGFIQALREQLGLKLVSTKGLVDVLIIDHVERPSEN